MLVTGGATAVGRALAIDLAAHGASVGVIDVDDAHGDETVAHIADAGGQAFYRHADVRVESEVAAAVDEVVQRFGRLDGAVNNAGTEAPMALLDADVATFQEVLDVNLIGVFRCLKHEALAMRRQGDGGAIVNVSSVTSGLTAAVGNGLYGTSKGGVDALTKSAGIELAAEGISVNSLAFIAADVPGGMFQRFFEHVDATPEQALASIPARRMLPMPELATAVRFLLDPAARYMVATTLVMDGGFSSQ
ncbi:SDR family NAD(P)-dependent oxidoreductase [Actinomycetospora sp. CA-101289]|uniref:SDR family NAD(P)-dependent oxidoreductase n=1 Tax=Actinomycetospora sp. CA-101289 TaxID=3239893 RepID=UPI003D989D2A